MEDRLAPATQIWTGFGLTNKMTNPQNWLSGVAPVVGDDLIFPPSIQTFVDYDYTTGTTFGSLTITGQLYTLTSSGGSTIQLSGGIFNGNKVLNGVNTINLEVDFINNQTVASTLESSDLIFNGTVSLIGTTSLTLDGAGRVFWNGNLDGVGTIIKNGIGQHFLRGNNTFGAGFNGDIIINNGVLASNRAEGLGSTGSTKTFVNDGGTLPFDGSHTLAENINARGLGFGGQGAINLINANITYNGQLTATGDLAIGVQTNALTFTVAVNAITQSGGSHDLIKVGTGTVRLEQQMQLSGELNITGGTVLVINNGNLASSDITIAAGGVLEINNNGTVANSFRIPDTTDIHLNSGTINLVGRASTTVNEFVGDIELVDGFNQISMNAVSAAAGTHLLLQSSALLRNDGATVNFNQASIVLGSAPGTISNRILFSAPPALTATGTSAGILPYATRNNTMFVSYLAAPASGLHGIVGLTDLGTAIPAQAPSATIAAAAASNNNVRMDASETINSNITINSLNFAASAARTITINAGFTLTIGAGGIINTGNTVTITGGGFLRLNSPVEAEGFHFGSNITNYHVEISGPTLDSFNISGVQDVDINFGNNVAADRANSYRGITRVHAGDLILNKPSGILAVPGDLVIGDGNGVFTGSTQFDRVQILDGRTGQTANTLVDPLVAAAIGPTGGGATGGSLTAGSYYVVYTFFTGVGETLGAPQTTTFTVDGDDIPRVVLPVGGIPAGAAGVNIYLSNFTADPASETFYGLFTDGTVNIDLIAAHAPGGAAPPITNTSRPLDVTVKGGGILDLPNTTGLKYPFRNVTLQASNSTGFNDVQGNAAIQTDASTVTLTGTVTVLKPLTPSYILAGQAHIGQSRGNFGLSTNPRLELGINNSGDRVFNIEDGAAPNDLVISVIMEDPGTHRLVKNGLGTLQLRFGNNLHEETVVNAGKLAVYGTTPSGTYTVGPGAQLLGGLTTTTGVVGPAVNVSGSVRPGAVPDANEIAGSPDFNNDTRGILQANGAVSFLSGGELVIEIAGYSIPGRDYDRFVVGGAVNIATGTTLVLDLNGLPPLPGTITGVLTYASRVGFFEDIVLINNPFNLVPILNYNSTPGSLDITFSTVNHPVSNNTVAVAPNKGRPGTVEVWDANTNSVMYTIAAFVASAHVEVAVGDVNNDSVLDIIAAQKGVVKVYDGNADLGTPPLLTFRPFGAAYKGIVYLAVGDLDNQVGDDLAVGRGSGASLVRGWSSFTFGNFSVANRLFNFKAYPGTSGVRIALGNTNGIGDDEIVTLPGNKRPVEVRVFDISGAFLALEQPYGSSFKNGSYLATGDFDNDGKDDIVVGPGSHNPGLDIKVLSGANLNVVLSSPGFIPFLGATQPVRVAVGDFDNDSDLDIIAALGSIGRTVRAFDINGNQVDTDLQAFDFAFNGGLCIGAGSN